MARRNTHLGRNAGNGCADLFKWQRKGGREAQEGGDICIHIADSRCCTGEINTTLKSNYTPIKDIKTNDKEQRKSPTFSPGILR